MAGVDDEDGTNSPGIVALWIAGLLLIIVSLMNVSPSDELLIDLSQYREVLESGKIDSIRVVDGAVHIKLRSPERFREGGRYVQQERLTVNLGRVTPEMEKDWESRGVELRFEQRKKNWLSALSDAVPWLLFPGLICLGVGYIIRAAQRSRAGIKTPRERLKALDERHQAGELSDEDFARQNSEILSEM